MSQIMTSAIKTFGNLKTHLTKMHEGKTPYLKKRFILMPN